jgi:GntR family transcriptional regulator, transcriptional repressor for pyruvate dehydrogenase complex
LRRFSPAAQAVEPAASPPPPAASRRLGEFRPIRLKTASDEVVSALADAIRGGLYDVGDLLPTERDLALRLGVSRTVVREAIAALRQAGIVSVRRGTGGGAVVVSLASLPAVLRGLRAESRENLRALLEARRAVETTAAVLTIERASDDDLKKLERLVAPLEGLLDRPDEFFEVDARFHIVIGEISGNPVIWEYQRTTLNRISAIRAGYPVGHVELRLAIANQRHTMAALRSRRRTRVLRSLDDHLGSVEEYFLGERLHLLRTGSGTG